MSDSGDDSPSSYLGFLPSIYHQSLDLSISKEAKAIGEISGSANPFLARYLKIFERILSGIENDHNLRGYVFSLQEGYPGLDDDEISPELVLRFEAAGLALEQEANLETVEMEKIWLNNADGPITRAKIWKLDSGPDQYFFHREKGEIKVYSHDRKGIEESLRVIPEFFHPRFSFLFSRKSLEEETSLLPIDQKARQKFLQYVHPEHDFPKWLHEFLHWLASWIAVSLREKWSLEKKRRLISQIIPLYRKRGTKEGIEEFLKIYLESDKAEAKLIERIKPFGINSSIRLDRKYAVGGRPYYFVVYLKLKTLNLDERREAIQTVRDVLELERPAHTVYELKILSEKTMKLESGKTRIGKNTIIGKWKTNDEKDFEEFENEE